MEKKNRKRKKKKSYREHNGFKLLVVPQTEAEFPAFENALADEFEHALKSPDGQMRIRFAFPGRSQVEAQVIGAEFTRILEQAVREVSRSWGGME